MGYVEPRIDCFNHIFGGFNISTIFFTFKMLLFFKTDYIFQLDNLEENCVPISVGNSHRSASPRSTTLEEDRELFVDFSSILSLWENSRRTREFHFLDANSLIFVSNRQWYVVDFDFDCRCGSHFGVIASCFEGLIMWIHHSLSVCFRKDMLFN